MDQAYAETEFILIRKTGEKVPCTVRIGIPYRENDLSWRCPVALLGWYGKLADIAGVDSFQSLYLANRLVHDLLLKFVEGGGKVMYPRIHEEIPLESYFGNAV